MTHPTPDTSRNPAVEVPGRATARARSGNRGIAPALPVAEGHGGADERMVRTASVIGPSWRAIRGLEKVGRNVREWFAVRDQFSIMFIERFAA